MADFDTVRAVTANLRRTLETEGVRFSRSVYDDDSSIPAGSLPLGRITYTGETFGYSHGQKPGYGEAAFTVRVVAGPWDPAEALREQQRWVHAVRDALTVEALNTGELEASKPVSLVRVSGAEAGTKGRLATVSLRVQIRYRESQRP